MFKFLGNTVGSIAYAVGEGLEFAGNCCKELGEWVFTPDPPSEVKINSGEVEAIVPFDGPKLWTPTSYRDVPPEL